MGPLGDDRVVPLGLLMRPSPTKVAHRFLQASIPREDIDYVERILDSVIGFLEEGEMGSIKLPEEFFNEKGWVENAKAKEWLLANLKNPRVFREFQEWGYAVAENFDNPYGYGSMGNEDRQRLTDYRPDEYIAVLKRMNFR
jgi:hypothetical protein